MTSAQQPVLPADVYPPPPELNENERKVWELIVEERSQDPRLPAINKTVLLKAAVLGGMIRRQPRLFGRGYIVSEYRWCLAALAMTPAAFEKIDRDWNGDDAA